MQYYWHILKSLASMYESWGSQFFTTTTGIQLRPDAFEISRLAVILLSNLRVNAVYAVSG